MMQPRPGRDVQVKVLRKVKRRLEGSFAARSAVGALREADSHATTLDEGIDLSFGFDHHGIRIAPYQVRSEIRGLLELLEERRPRVVVQIGTCTGGTLYLLARAAAPDAVLTSVDLYHGQFGGGYSPWRARLYRAFRRPGQRIELVLGDSHTDDTRRRVTRAIGNRPIDFLFIDGDHRYEGVSKDFELYAPLVAPDGLIAFHDIVPGQEAAVGGVPRFWAELKARGGATRELVEDWHQGSAGIGLLEPGT
jgi:predicted O-methyltransferase YrrM